MKVSSDIIAGVRSQLTEDVDFQLHLANERVQLGMGTRDQPTIEILGWLTGYHLHLLKSAYANNAEEAESLRLTLLDAVLDRMQDRAATASLSELTAAAENVLADNLKNSVDFEATRRAVVSFVEELAVGSETQSAKELRGDCFNAAYASAFAYRRHGYIDFDQTDDTVRCSANYRHRLPSRPQ